MTSDFIVIEMFAVLVAVGIGCCIWLVLSVVYELAQEWESKNDKPTDT